MGRSDSGRWSWRASTEIFTRNPGGGLMLVVVGLMTILAQVPGSLVIANSAAAHWGKDMSRNMGFVDFLRYTLATLCAGPVGSIGDRYGHRIGAFVSALIQSVPILALLVFGDTELGLSAWSVARVLTGVTGATVSGAPAAYALMHDVVLPEDYDAFLGMAVASAGLALLLGTFGGAAVIKISHGSSYAALIYLAGLAVALQVAIALVRVRGEAQAKEKGGESASPAVSEESNVQAEASESNLQVEASVSNLQAEASESNVQAKAMDASRFDGAKRAVVGPFAAMRFAYSEKGLFTLCLITALVSMPESVLFDVMHQYTFSNLGLMGEAVPKERRSMLSLQLALCLQVSLLCGACCIGFLSKRMPSHRLLKGVIPSIAVLQVFPVLLRVVPVELVAYLASIAIGLSLIVLPPLNALTPQVSPEGHLGQSVGAVASAKCFASMVANLFVSAFVPLLQRTGMEKPLWILYPFAGFVTVSAMPLVYGLSAALQARERSSSKDISGSPSTAANSARGADAVVEQV